MPDLLDMVDNLIEEKPKKAEKPREKIIHNTVPTYKPIKMATPKYNGLDPHTLSVAKDLIDYGYKTIHNKSVVREYRNLIANNQKIPEEIIEKKYVRMYILGKKILQYIREIEGIK